MSFTHFFQKLFLIISSFVTFWAYPIEQLKLYILHNIIDPKEPIYHYLTEHYASFNLGNTKVKFLLDFSSPYISVDSSVYDYKNSTSYKRLNETIKEIEFSGTKVIGYESREYSQYYSTLYDNFDFFLIDTIIQKNENTYHSANLGLAPGLNKKNVFQILKSKISDLKGNEFYFTNCEIRVNFGDAQDHFYDNKFGPRKYLPPININALEYQFDKVVFGTSKNYTMLPNKVTFTIDNEFLILPEKYFELIKTNLIGEQYFKNGLCKFKTIPDKEYYKFIYCEKNVNIKKYKKIKEVRFFPNSNESNLMLNLKYDDLIIEDYYYKYYSSKGRNIFMIMFDSRENAFDGWILGLHFLKLYDVAFDFENGSLIYYTNQLKNDVEYDDHTVEYILTTLFTVFAIAFVTGVIVLYKKSSERTISYITKGIEIILLITYLIYTQKLMEYTVHSFFKEIEYWLTIIDMSFGFIGLIYKLIKNFSNPITISPKNAIQKIIRDIVIIIFFFGSYYGLQQLLYKKFNNEMIVYTGALITFFVIDIGYDIMNQIIYLKKNDLNILK